MNLEKQKDEFWRTELSLKLRGVGVGVSASLNFN